MAREIAHDLAAAHRVADQRDVAEIVRVQHRREVVGEPVVVVAARGLGRLAMAAAVVGDEPQALSVQRRELLAPDLGAQRPAMDEDDGPADACFSAEELLAVPGRYQAVGRACRRHRSQESSGQGSEERASVHRDLRSLRGRRQ